MFGIDGLLCQDQYTVSIKNMTPVPVAKISIGGGALKFCVYEDDDFKMPTKRQRRMLKRLLAIEIEEIKTVKGE